MGGRAGWLASGRRSEGIGEGDVGERHGTRLAESAGLARLAELTGLAELERQRVSGLAS